MTDVVHLTVLSKEDRTMEERVRFRDKSFSKWREHLGQITATRRKKHLLRKSFFVLKTNLKSSLSINQIPYEINFQYLDLVHSLQQSKHRSDVSSDSRTGIMCNLMSVSLILYCSISICVWIPRMIRITKLEQYLCLWYNIYIRHFFNWKIAVEGLKLRRRKTKKSDRDLEYGLMY